MTEVEADIIQIKTQILHLRGVNLALLEGQMASISLTLNMLTNDQDGISKSLDNVMEANAEILKLIKEMNVG